MEKNIPSYTSNLFHFANNTIHMDPQLVMKTALFNLMWIYKSYSRHYPILLILIVKRYAKKYFQHYCSHMDTELLNCLMSNKVEHQNIFDS